MKNKQNKLKTEQFWNLKNDKHKLSVLHVFIQLQRLGIVLHKALNSMSKELRYAELLVPLTALPLSKGARYCLPDKTRLLTILIVRDYENRT